MPVPPRDHTGIRFGILTALRLDGRIHVSGRMVPAWLCRCDCGAEIRVSARHLTTSVTRLQRRSCDDCRMKACLVCGAPLPASSPRLICPGDCTVIRQRQRTAAYRERHKDDPSFKEAERAAARKHRESLTPEQRRQRSVEDPVGKRARKADWDARMANDPEHLAKRAAYREANAERIQAYNLQYQRRRVAERVAADLGEATARMKERLGGEE